MNTELLDQGLNQQELDTLGGYWSAVSGAPAWQGDFQAPSGGGWTSGYGERRTFWPSGFQAVHEGTDFASPYGASVWSAAAGVVTYTGSLPIRGNVVVVDHGFGVHTAYFHLQLIHVIVGQQIAAGQQVGTVGSTGRSTGPHLHWEVRIQGPAVDPIAWLQRSFAALTGGGLYQTPVTPPEPIPTPGPLPVPTETPPPEPPSPTEPPSG